jgi:hypothetical protein
MMGNENLHRRKPEAMRGFGTFESRLEERFEGYRMGNCGLDHLAWDWDMLQGLLYVVTRFQIPKKCRECFSQLTTEKLL